MKLGDLCINSGNILSVTYIGLDFTQAMARALYTNKKVKT